MDVSPEERAVLETLDDALRRRAVRRVVDTVAKELVREFVHEPDASMAWRPIPLELYGPPLPEDIRSSWVFVLRARRVTGPERHPNSRQRMMSYRGAGDFPTKIELADPWRSHHLDSDPRSPLASRWVSIPPNVWHQGVVANYNWVVVSFQTAAEDELIEERPDPNVPDGFVRKRYCDTRSPGP